VVNRDLDRAFGEVRAILAAERLKRERQPGLPPFVRGLRADSNTHRQYASLLRVPPDQVLPGARRNHLP